LQARFRTPSVWKIGGDMAAEPPRHEFDERVTFVARGESVGFRRDEKTDTRRHPKSLLRLYLP